MPATFDSLMRLDARLVRAGHHPLTAWWQGQLERLYAHPTALELVAQVGRGGAKSHTSAKVGLNETLCGDWHVPPGERHFFAYVSRNKDEAAQRLHLLEKFLRDLGVKFDTSGDAIALRDLPRGFRVFACNVGSVSGFRCFGYAADELAKWMAGAEHANPAGEVCASLNAMCVTHPGARKLLISSPFGVVDYHFERHAEGDTGGQLVANAPTWVANPSMSEAQTRKAERDERVWLREYAAIPQASATNALDPEQIAAAAERNIPSGYLYAQPVLSLDWASRGKDYLAYSCVRWMLPPISSGAFETRTRYEWAGRDAGLVPIHERVLDEKGQPIPLPQPARREPILLVSDIKSFDQAARKAALSQQLVARIAADAREWGCSCIIADAYSDYTLESMFLEHGLHYRSVNWDNSTKVAAVGRVRQWFRDGMISIPARESSDAAGHLYTELNRYSEKILPSGFTTYQAPSTGHDDHVSTLVTAAAADAHGWLPSAPYVPRVHRDLRAIADLMFQGS